MRFSLRGHRWALAAPLLALVAGCGGGDDGDQAGGGAAPDSVPVATQAPPPPPPAPAGTLTDGNIFAILKASGESEIVPSQAVVDRLQNAQVKQFAQEMVTQHTALNDTIAQVAKQNNITRAPNPVSVQLDSTGDVTARELRVLPGADLDRTYMQYMVTSHQGAYDAVTTKLIPSVQNPQLRTAMQQNVLPVVEAHLAEAQRILSTLGPP